MPEQAGSKPRKIEAVRGTADLLPEEAGKWRGAEAIIRDWFGRYGFGEIRTPVFEHAELFHRPLGEGSDVVSKEMYEFRDRGGRILALRPEGTAPVVRAFIEHGLYAKGGRQKLFYIGPIFRYDRPQAGRYRQHHQAGVEVFGDPSAETDADLVFLAVDLLHVLGVRELTVRVNSGGCPKCRPAYQDELRKFFTSQRDRLCKDCSGHRLEHNVLRVLDCKEEGCKKAASGAPDIEKKLCRRCCRRRRGSL